MSTCMYAGRAGHSARDGRWTEQGESPRTCSQPSRAGETQEGAGRFADDALLLALFRPTHGWYPPNSHGITSVPFVTHVQSSQRPCCHRGRAFWTPRLRPGPKVEGARGRACLAWGLIAAAGGSSHVEKRNLTRSITVTGYLGLSKYLHLTFCFFT